MFGSPTPTKQTCSPASVRALAAIIISVFVKPSRHRSARRSRVVPVVDRAGRRGAGLSASQRASPSWRRTRRGSPGRRPTPRASASSASWSRRSRPSRGRSGCRGRRSPARTTGGAPHGSTTTASTMRPGMIVRFGSARIDRLVDELLDDDDDPVGGEGRLLLAAEQAPDLGVAGGRRRAARGRSSRPAGAAGRRRPRSRRRTASAIGRMSGLTDGQVGLEVAAQREERQVHRAGGVAADHPEVAVLLDLERLRGDRRLSIRRRMACERRRRPGCRASEKTSLRGDAGARSSGRRSTSGVSRARVRSRRRWRMISCPAAKQMRWVKPSMATVSPSRTRSAIASRIVATFEAAHPVLIVPPRRINRPPRPRGAHPPARPRQDVAAVPATSATASRRSAARCPSRRPRPQGRRHPDAATCRTRGPAGRAGSRPAGPPRRARPCRTRRRASGPGRGRRDDLGPARRWMSRRPCRPGARRVARRCRCSPPSSRSIVASAAAQATGLPP